MFERILIASRGEVAARIARSCRRLGVETVGVHVRGEEDALHVEACDTTVSLGEDPSLYDTPAAIVEAARAAGVHAVHPGYGALASDFGFASALTEAGIAFVGPNGAELEAALDRRVAFDAALQAGVHVLPSAARAIMEPGEALAAIEEIDYPVVIRPVRGSDTREPPHAEDVTGLSDALAALGPLDAIGGAYIERWIERARRVEVELVGDGEEAVVLSDREVSVHKGGRRVLSESPAPALDQLHHSHAVRGAIWDASAEIAGLLRCRGLAICKYLIDAHGTFYFAGFVPTLRIEHTTTEMRTGLDLVEMQLRLAAGESMPPELFRAEATGTAVQAWIDAAADPETGHPFESRVERARWPPAPQGKVRIETAVKIGSLVLPAHDPLIATITTYAPTRHDAILILDRMLAETHLHPLVTNVRLLRKALNHESFRASQYDDGFLERI